ncbi:CynX/NimT family MFS transporter [Planotetraspora thailandica]|uniref:CynX/NimT family MFS transporter n=1 Tax=Planotetraspora thailandica TaxID=487172 RepID=UPI00194EA7BC|nr:MFS transporter [Planotetraspora thailandica]
MPNTSAAHTETGRQAPGSSRIPEEPRAAYGRPAVWLAVSVILLALNLRPALVAVSPLLDTIRSTTGMSATTAGLLTTLPLLCFGLLAPLAPQIGSRWGMEPTLAATMALVCAGTALRMLDAMAGLLAGTVLIGAGIAVANVLLPGVIKRDFPSRIGLMTSLYSMSMFGGAALAAGVTVPVEHAADLAWRPTLALWGLPAILALIVWMPQVLRHTRTRATGARGATPPVRGLWRHQVAWMVTLYMGLQSLAYYAATAWLPSVLTDAGTHEGVAGWMLSFSSLLGIVGAFLTPILANRHVHPGVLASSGAVLCVLGFVGLLVSPTAWIYLWMVLLGLGQGAAISLAMLFIVLRAPDARHAAQLSSMAQCFGYVLAALGPLTLGGVHQLTGGWTIPLLLLAVLVLPQIVFGLGAARERHASPEQRS